MIPPARAPASAVDSAARLRPVSGSPSYNYLLSLPAEYVSESTRDWPLILFLHGAAERGQTLQDVVRHGLPKLLADGAELSEAERALGREIASRFVVVAPQCAAYEVWDDARLLALLDHIVAAYKVDTRRVYLTGMSMGGFGAWSLGMRHPQRFAALVPICGGGRVADVERAASTQRAALDRLAIWAFHGAGDIVVPLEESARMVEALRKVGRSDVKFTVYPDLGHDSWTRSYGNPELYTWLLEHGR